MFTLLCPSCGSGRNVQVTAAMPLRAWLHCGECNHLWKTSGALLVCRWLLGGTLRGPDADNDDRIEVRADAPLPARVPDTGDPAIEQWLCQGSEGENPRAADLSVSAWLETDPLQQPVQQNAKQAEIPSPEIGSFDDCFLPARERTRVTAPATLGERLDTFYDGLLRLEEFVKRCASQEQAVADAAAQAAAASAKVAAVHATAARVGGGSVLPFHRKAG